MALEIVEAYLLLTRVTSHTKPLKAGATLATCGVCGAIQKLPDVAARAEQPVLTARDAIARLRLLLEQVVIDPQLPADGSMLDIACGNEAAPVNFAGAYPDWRLSGSDLTDDALPSTQRLPNFARSYAESLLSIDGRTLVSMINSLEHISRPLEVLEAAVGLLERGDSVMAEVPRRRDFASSACRCWDQDGLGDNDAGLRLPARGADIPRASRGSAALPRDPGKGRIVAEASLRSLADVFAVSAELADGQPSGACPRIAISTN